MPLSCLQNALTIDLSPLASRVNEYPLFYRYPGTSVVPNCVNLTWYVYSSPLYVANNTIIEAFQAGIKAYADGHTGILQLNETTDPDDDGITVWSNAGKQNRKSSREKS